MPDRGLPESRSPRSGPTPASSVRNARPPLASLSCFGGYRDLRKSSWQEWRCHSTAPPERPVQKRAEMRIHHVNRRLHSIEMKRMFVGSLKHAQVFDGILVTCEADVANFARLPCFLNSFDGPTGSEDSIWIVEANNLMELQEINHIRLQAPQRLLNLSGSGVLIPAIDLCRQENLLSITIAECLAHPVLADTSVVIPAVIHQSDTAIDCRAKQTDALIGVLLFPKVIAAYADCRNTFTGAAKFAINHMRRLKTAGPIGRLSALCARRRDRSCGSNGSRLQEISASCERLLSERFCPYGCGRDRRLLGPSDGRGVDPYCLGVLKSNSMNFSSQRIAFTTPPSTRSAAPLVAEESSLAT
jgi:hypothetical protein